MTGDQTRQKTESIVNRLLEAVSNISYGSAGVTLRIHDGRIVDVTHVTTESMRQIEQEM
jgi:hypothetical protein